MIATYPASNYADYAQYYLGRSYHEQLTPDFANARLAYSTLISTFPTSTLIDDAQYQIGKTYYDANDYTTAITELELVIAQYPASNSADQARYFIGRSYHEMEVLNPVPDFTTARQQYQLVISNYPGSTWADNAQYQIGKTYYDSVDYAQAIIELQKVVDSYGSLASAADDAQYYIGRCHHEAAILGTDSFSIARDSYTVLINIYPQSNWTDNASYQIGRTYYDNGEYAQAQIEFQATLSTFPDSNSADNAQYYLARSIHLQGDTANPSDPYFAAARIQYQLLLDTPLYANSIYLDNALYYIGMTYHDELDCPNELTALQLLLSTYPASSYVTLAQPHIDEILAAIHC
jgi:TolA-binding protein